MPERLRFLRIVISFYTYRVDYSSRVSSNSLMFLIAILPLCTTSRITVLRSVVSPVKICPRLMLKKVSVNSLKLVDACSCLKKLLLETMSMFLDSMENRESMLTDMLNNMLMDMDLELSFIKLKK